MKSKYIEVRITIDPYKSIDFLETIKKLVERVLQTKGYNVWCKLTHSNIVNNFSVDAFFDLAKNELRDIKDEINFIIYNHEAYYNYL